MQDRNEHINFVFEEMGIKLTLLQSYLSLRLPIPLEWASSKDTTAMYHVDSISCSKTGQLQGSHNEVKMK
jgi:hypothetical protein